jgi:L-alanine-DL-glutamate epimerase-like enolase superfamily enzyme
MPRFTARHESLPLTAPFRISRGVKTAAEVVVVEAEQDGIVGRGEAVPYARYGETVESVLAQVRAGGDLPAGAARNAVDLALWDLRARLEGRSVAEITGRPLPGEIVTAVTISLDEPEAMHAAALAVADAPLIKVKVNGERVEERIRAVVAAAPNARLIVDPNEGWDFELLDSLQPVLADLNIDLLEQPIPASDDARLEGYRPAIPICADEAAHVAADLGALSGRYQAVNIKLDKSGGLTEALVMLEGARALGFQVMTGCMVASSLAIVPALHIAGASDFADLDGPWWIKDDRPGGVRIEQGRLYRPMKGFWGELG